MNIRDNKSVINERKQKLFALLTRGLKGYEIAKELNVDPATISRDIKYLKPHFYDLVILDIKMPDTQRDSLWLLRFRFL